MVVVMVPRGSALTRSAAGPWQSTRRRAMRSLRVRLPILVAILWAGIGSSVWALGHGGGAVETAYILPSTTTVATTTLAVPTSYLVDRTWVEPTAYVVPSYYATAYRGDPLVVQPSYVSTAYVRTGLFGRRRLVERSAIASY